jgi:hypothetical protein
MPNLDSRVQPINHLQTKAIELLCSLCQSLRIGIERGRLQFFFGLLALASLPSELGVLAQQLFVATHINPWGVPGVDHVIPSLSRLAKFEHQFMEFSF